MSSRRVRQMIEEGKLEAQRTPFGAFRLPGELVRQEQRRREATAAIGGEIPSKDVPLGMGAEGRVSGAPMSHLPSLLTERSVRWGLGLTLSAALGVGLLIGLSWGGGSSGGARGGSGLASPAPGVSPQRVVMLIDAPPSNGLQSSAGKLVDAFVPSAYTVRSGAPVRLTIFNYDDTPHTFTSPVLGVDALVPPARGENPSSVTVLFTPTRPGAYRWRCRVPCDPWSMTRQGYMRGTVRVIAA